MNKLLITHQSFDDKSATNDVILSEALGEWIRISRNTYVIETELTPKELYDKVSPIFDERDYLRILSLAGPTIGRNQRTVDDWLKARFPLAR